MKILYIAHRIPYPPNKGDKIRSFNELKYLAEHHNVDLISLVDEPEEHKYKGELEQLCNRVALFSLNKSVAKVKGIVSLAVGGTISVGYFYQKKVQQLLDLWLQEESFDAIICFSSTMAEYIFRSKVYSTLKVQEKPKLIMDFCDVDSDKWLQYADDARFPMNFVYRLENQRLIDYERRVYANFDHSVLISVAEKDLFQQICPDVNKLSVVPNGVDHHFFTPECKPSPFNLQPSALSLVFTGAMDYHANVDGVIWFCREIWPTLKTEFPDLLFYIVGNKPTAEVTDLANIDGITVTGFVDDIREYYQLADVCVVPLRMARGVQNKVLEAMAMGNAVVTTAKANAGIQATDNEQLQVANTADEFIQAVRRLLKNSESREILGKNAREFVVASYDWNANLEKLEKLLTG